MGIFRRRGSAIKLWSEWLCRIGIGGCQSDALLDWRIADALSDDAWSTVPPGAWDRLRKAINERKLVRGYGMWVLDETFREPPDSPPATLSGVELERALRVYRKHQAAKYHRRTPSVWGSWSPTFFVHYAM
ncbi:MAG TPA: hypothetical protein PKD46_03750 [Aggregatilineaceae bacterium]|nr:hypothetical protein [Anaerolineae bacterium]HMM27380.1 hypothetical protein [Aggregatilineaceae bacterium]